MIRVYASVYPERKPLRMQEIRKCLEQNLASPEIDAVCLLLEGIESPLPDHPKLKSRRVSHRPQYRDFFDWANELVQSNTDISVIANSDIFFDSSISPLAKALMPEQCAALARWDLQPDGSSRLFDRNDSQDVWIFRGKIRPVVADFCVGIPRCDNRILHELRAAGYDVINPAFSVRAFHLHAGSRAEYPGEIQGLHVDPPYAYLWPHNLMSLPQTLWHRWRHPEAKLGWRSDWRRFRQSLPVRMARKAGRMVLTKIVPSSHAETSRTV